MVGILARTGRYRSRRRRRIPPPERPCFNRRDLLLSRASLAPPVTHAGGL